MSNQGTTQGSNQTVQELQDLIKVQLETYVNLTKGSDMGNFYKQQLKDLKPVQLESVYDIFTPEQIDIIKKVVNPQQHECYKNSFTMVSYFPFVHYVEGFVNFGVMNIEHAFNSYKGHYFDITTELVLNSKPQEEGYSLIGEYNSDEVMEVFYRNKCTGSFYTYKYNQSHPDSPIFSFLK